MGLGSFFGKIIGSGIGEAATSVADVIDRFVDTPAEKEAAAILRTKIMQKPGEWQAQINMIEAKHRTIFVAGWRPAIGWICALAMGWGWIVMPTIVYFVPRATMPTINTTEAVTLVMSLLGLGVLRTVEKARKITN